MVASIVEELTQRGGLASALSGRDTEGLLSIIKHLVKNISDPRYTRLLCALCHRLLDMYPLPTVKGSQAGKSEIKTLMLAMQDQVSKEVRVQDNLLGIKGAIESILATAGTI